MENRLEPVSNKEGGILASIWRQIIKQLNLMPALDYLVARYISKSKRLENKIPSMKRKTKSTLIKNITTTDMTWKVFLDLVFNLLEVKRIRLDITLTHANGEETRTSVKINNTVLHVDDDEDTSLDKGG